MTHFQLENVFLQRILKKEFFAISISVRPIDVVSTIDTIVSHLFKINLPSRKKILLSIETVLSILHSW